MAGGALTAGGATDASLGYSIFEDAAEALLPGLGLCTASELRKLGTGVEAILARRPIPERLLENEGASMRAAMPSTRKAVKGSQPKRLTGGRVIRHIYWDISAPHPAGSLQNHIW